MSMKIIGILYKLQLLFIVQFLLYGPFYIDVLQKKTLDQWGGGGGANITANKAAYWAYLDQWLSNFLRITAPLTK